MFCLTRFSNRVIRRLPFTGPEGQVKLIRELNHVRTSPIRVLLYKCSSFTSVTAFLLVPDAEAALCLNAEGDCGFPWCSVAECTKRDASNVWSVNAIGERQGWVILRGVCCGVGKDVRVFSLSVCAEYSDEYPNAIITVFGLRRSANFLPVVGCLEWPSSETCLYHCTTSFRRPSHCESVVEDRLDRGSEYACLCGPLRPEYCL